MLADVAFTFVPFFVAIQKRLVSQRLNIDACKLILFAPLARRNLHVILLTLEKFLRAPMHVHNVCVVSRIVVHVYTLMK